MLFRVGGIPRLIAGAIFCMSLTGHGSASYGAERADMSLEGKSVYIVHGYSAGPSDHWFEWLRRKVESRGGTARVVELPNSSNPEAEAWRQALTEQIEPLGRDAFIVAHSLGSIATLRFLDLREGAELGGLILVSGFEDELPSLPELDAFMTSRNFNPENVRSMVEKIIVFSSTDDVIVDPELSRKLARSLKAEFQVVEGGGHFLASDGYTSFPELWDTLVRVAGR